MGKRWSAEELDYLRRNYRRVPTALISLRLGRSVCSVHAISHKIGATRPTFKASARAWLPEEDGILLELYGSIRSKELAKELGRTTGSVRHRAEELGLFSKRWSPEFRRRQSLPRTGREFTGLTDPTILGYVAGIIDGEGSILAPP